MTVVRVVVAALVLHAAWTLALVVAHAAAVDLEPSSVAAIVASAAVAGALARPILTRVAPGAESVVVAVALTWLVVGVVHHYLVGIDPRWDSGPVAGAGHLAWDVVFHLPAILLAAVAPQHVAGPAARRAGRDLEGRQEPPGASARGPAR